MVKTSAQPSLSTSQRRKNSHGGSAANTEFKSTFFNSAVSRALD
jgi:hypothetical protein